ncbi:hypothetical protein BLAT2472_10129 [Burkholderia latens]
MINNARKISLTRADCPIYKVSTPSPGGALRVGLGVLPRECGRRYNSSFFDLNEWGTKVWIPVS